MAAHKFRAGLGLLVKPFRDVAVFTGRSTRTETGLFVWLLAMLFHTLDGAFAGSGWPFALELRWLVLGIATLPQFALMSRRVQDFDVPGWIGWSSVALLLVFAWASGQLPGQQPANLPLILIVPAVALILFLWGFVLYPPSQGSNRFGPNPRPQLAAAQ